VKNKGQICNLSELKIMQQAIVTNINIKNKNVKRHLLDMGITKGVKIKIKKIAPMGDPIDIELRGYELAIRKKDLKDIEGIVL
jgi:ferrous iron transport protein A